MVYNDSTNNTGICQEIDDLCGSNSTSYPLTSKARRLNSALDDFVQLAVTEAMGWSVADSAETDLGIATITMTSAQSNYPFPTEMLEVEKIEALQDDGTTWIELTPTDQLDPNAGSGVPKEYKKVENSYIISPTPSYTETNGLRVHYRRAFNYATVSGTTFSPTTPGIPSIFHTWMGHKAALPYLIETQSPYRNDVAQMIVGGNNAIIAYFSKRAKDEKRRLTANIEQTK